MAGIYLSWAADCAREAARGTPYRVVEVAGWQARGHGGYRVLEGIVGHHTGTPDTAQGDYPSLNVVTNGRADLAGPLCTFGLGRDGTIYVVAAGVAWHAGPSTYAGFTDLNDEFAGIEAESAGGGKWTPEQLDCYPRLVAAFLRRINRPAERYCSHRTCATPKGRKPDPVGIDDKWMQDEVRRLWADPGVPIPAPPQGLDVATLAAAMGNVKGIPYDQYLGPFVDGMAAAQITNVKRAAMWFAQLGEESGGLRWMEEIADGSAYEGREDLGNTQPGDGKRFKGRGPIQLTGRGHYAEFGRWCHARGYVPSDDYFTQTPTLLEQPHWGFMAASWYWVVERPSLNAVSDAGDVVTATHLINGGERGLADRQARYARALTFGDRLLPAEDDDMAQVPQAEWDSLVRDLRADLAHKQQQIDQMMVILRMLFEQHAGAGADPFDPAKMFPGWECPDGAKRTLVDIGRRNLEQLDSKLA